MKTEETMGTQRAVTRNPATYRVCGGQFFVNGDPVPLSRRILKIGAVAAGLDAMDPCGPIPEGTARLILHMERTMLLDGLTKALGGGHPGRAA